uniref:Uncharacterized protein n=1 Tax=Populus trichocarpa TaxID=3694 RepID=A0A3N7EK16_POPTR
MDLHKDISFFFLSSYRDFVSPFPLSSSPGIHLTDFVVLLSSLSHACFPSLHNLSFQTITHLLSSSPSMTNAAPDYTRSMMGRYWVVHCLSEI